MAPVPPTPTWPMPKFNLRIEDLDHEGVDVFLNAVNPKKALQEAVTASYQWLYSEDNPPPKVVVILLVLRAMDGVAHTLGNSTHKEIHFSLDYILHSKGRARDEIMGVLVHEVVHCYQYNGNDTCPGGLIEGIADFVRLHAGLVPPHWRRRGEDADWDAGYDTTAYFLEWIDNRYGYGTIRELNCCLKEDDYRGKVFKELTGRPVRKLWQMYCLHLKGDDIAEKDGDEEGAEANEDEDEDEDEDGLEEEESTEGGGDVEDDDDDDDEWDYVKDESDALKKT